MLVGVNGKAVGGVCENRKERTTEIRPSVMVLSCKSSIECRVWPDFPGKHAEAVVVRQGDI